ncbi:MAG: hypothetical protein KDA30_15625, partial [Phycisphaerales bacterium]|nr:hypothetical protein [Phycisphaerales bacterium]
LLQPSQTKLDWHDLKDYADHLAEQGHANACVLQVLYRSAIRGETVSTDLRAAVMTWLTESPERQVLEPLILARLTGQSSTKMCRSRNKKRRKRK